MSSNLELLRQGKAVQFEPGVTGRLNPKNKTLELSTGEVINAAKSKHFFPENEQELALSRQRESVEKGAKGTAGEFYHQYTSKGIPGAIADWPAYLSQSGQEYATRKQAEQQTSNRISKESPYTSGAATVANVATDLALTRGMSALKAAPLLTAASSGSRLASEPGEVLGETALAAGLGFGLDKVSSYLGKVAARRGESRSLPGRQEAVRTENAAGREATAQGNALQQQEFNAAQQRVSNENAARLHQNQLELNANQASKSAGQAENKRLSQQFKQQQSDYDKSLKELPALQKKAQEEYSANVVRTAADIEKSFPKNSKILSSELGVEDFIDSQIRKTGIGGTADASRSIRTLRSIFPEGEIIGGRELSSRYKALEDAIQRSTPEVQAVLNNFKQSIGRRLPSILEDSIAFGKVAPILKRTLENDVKSILNEINFSKSGVAGAKDSLTSTALANTRNVLRGNLTPENFVQKIRSGELSQELANRIVTVEDFLGNVSSKGIQGAQKSGLLQPIMDDARQKHSFFVRQLTDKLQKNLSKYETKAMETAKNASKKFSRDIKKTYGVAEPLPSPIAPQAPVPVANPSSNGQVSPFTGLPSPIGNQPTRPQLLPAPNRPVAQNFTPQPEPTLPAANGVAEASGDFLERNLLGAGTPSLVNNPITKLAGLKYLLGGAALPVEGAYLAAKGLTSPTAVGQVARMTFKQGGIGAIESWAQRYPSYNNGILEDPQDRRSLTKEIEDDPNIPIEQKAIVQSKINRGKPVQQRL